MFSYKCSGDGPIVVDYIYICTTTFGSSHSITKILLPTECDSLPWFNDFLIIIMSIDW
jgi:hypothetical protein